MNAAKPPEQSKGLGGIKTLAIRTKTLHAHMNGITPWFHGRRERVTTGCRKAHLHYQVLWYQENIGHDEQVVNLTVLFTILLLILGYSIMSVCRPQPLQLL